MSHLTPRTRWLLLTLALLAGPPLDVVQAQPPAGKKYALLVGVRDYDSARLASLRFPENDVEELAAVLQKQASFTEVRLLTSTRGAKNKDHAPTAANIRTALRELLERKTRHDLVLLALVGHGLSSTLREGRTERDESFFCPSDAKINDASTLLGMSRLFADLGDCGARTKLLLVDAARNDPAIGRGLSTNRLHSLSHGTAALFSCGSGQRAFETPRLGKGHGVFFHYLIEGLKGEAKNHRGEVTWGRLVEYVSDRLADDVPKVIGGGAKQTPDLIAYLPGTSLVLVPAAGGAAPGAAPR
jgi:uncharacterized caspase-like protein